MAAMGEPDWGGGPQRPALRPPRDARGRADRRPRPPRRRLRDVHGPQETVAAHRQRQLARPDAGGAVGDLVEVTLVNDERHRRHDPALARGRRAQRRRRGRRRDAGRGGPGEEFAYRFVADQAGTFWYHSHQVSHEQVRRACSAPWWSTRPTRPRRRRAGRRAPRVRRRPPRSTATRGTRSSRPSRATRCGCGWSTPTTGWRPVWVTGAPYRVLAVDGTDVNQPGEVTDATVALPAGGRVDLGIAVPEGGAHVELRRATRAGARRGPRRRRRRGRPRRRSTCSRTASPADLGFDPAAADRKFDYRIGKRPGFLDGKPGMWWTVNGKLFPDVPMYMVSEGDVVVFDIENSSDDAHPDAPPRPPRGRGVARRRAGDRGPVVGRLTGDRAPARPSRSRSSPTTRASGWTTATTCRTPRRGWSRT